MWKQGGSEGGERKEKQETNSRLRIQHALQASFCLRWRRDGAPNCLGLEGLPSSKLFMGIRVGLQALFEASKKDHVAAGLGVILAMLGRFDTTTKSV